MTREYREYAKSRIEYLLKISRLDERDKEALEAAIQSLSQEPCDDTVSRQAVLDEINRIGIKAFETYTDYSQLYDFVDTLPSVTQESDEQLYKNGFADGYEQGYKDAEQKSGKWIPVSERLPEDAYGCLVTVYDTDLRTQDEFENILPYFVGYDGETWNNFCGEPIPFEVIAWMPLPKPYEPQESEARNDIY